MTNLDHFFHKKTQAHPLLLKKVLLAYSGGLDSAVLLHLFSKWKGVEVVLGHVHHGDHSNREYRDQVLALAESAASKYGLQLKTFKVKAQLESEAELREARHQQLQFWAHEVAADVIVTAHHQDDLLETRLLKLIRGAGPQGLVSFQEHSLKYWRPLMEVSKVELLEYAQKEGILFLQDPTNAETEAVRNWLRQEWLPALERKVPGASGSLGRSLELIVEELREQPSALQLHNQSHGLSSREGLDLLFLESLSQKSRRSLLAGYLLESKKRDFSYSQIEEILKRLDSSQKVHTFKVAGLVWSVNAGRVKVLD